MGVYMCVSAVHVHAHGCSAGHKGTRRNRLVEKEGTKEEGSQTGRAKIKQMQRSWRDLGKPAMVSLFNKTGSCHPHLTWPTAGAGR